MKKTGETIDFRCPVVCPRCGALWKGGSVKPNDKMKNGLRVFFDCKDNSGGMSVTDNGGCGYVILLSCGGEDNE